MASDDSGGVIVVWADHRDYSGTTPGILYAQRVDAQGRIRWAEGGIVVCSAHQRAEPSLYPVIVADGGGGVVIAWPDSRKFDGSWEPACEIYGQRVSRSGATLWAADGVPLSGAPDTVSECAIGSDGHGGAIVAWTRWLSGNRVSQIWVQSVDSGGSLRWGNAGRMLAATSALRRFPQVVPDGVGGAIVGWEASKSIEAQRISSSGEFPRGAAPDSPGSIVAMPNPTRDDALLRLALYRSGHATVAIHDLAGRRVRALFEGDLDAGERWIAWDGRDDDGSRVRPGVYFARVTHPGTRTIGRIVLLP